MNDSEWLEKLAQTKETPKHAGQPKTDGRKCRQTFTAQATKMQWQQHQ